MWTRFFDMCSGGRQKEKWGHIYIEAPQPVAEVIFTNRFGHNPHHVTCRCCGEDYSVAEDESLEQITAYDRNCASGYFYKDDQTLAVKDPKFNELDYDFDKIFYRGREVEGRYYEASRESYGCTFEHVPLDEYLNRNEYVLVIPVDDINPEEREGDYSWQDSDWEE